MELVYINSLNTNYKNENIYEFIFAKSASQIEEGNDWGAEPASSGEVTPPDIDSISAVGILKTTEVELNLVINSDSFSMYDATEDIIALGWEVDIPKVDDRLVFRFGEKQEAVEKKLSVRKLKLIYEK
jgi:hypothetical protein